MDRIIFGHILRMLRTTAGISLRKMAKRIQVSPSYLSQVELGKLPPPTHDRIAKIAETIGIPVSFLSEMSARLNPDIMLLLKGHQELNELVKSTHDIGLEHRDILEIIALMRDLGGSGFRKFIHYGVNHSSDFKPHGSGHFYPELVHKQTQRMGYPEFVNPRFVFTNLDFTAKGDLLRFLIEKVGSIYHTLNVNDAYVKLMAREAETSSGLVNGVAIPHLFVKGLDKTILVIGRIPGGVDFNTVDMKPVYFICLILSDQKDYLSHLNLLAFLARRFLNPIFINNLIKAKSKKHILSLLFSNAPSSTN